MVTIIVDLSYVLLVLLSLQQQRRISDSLTA